MAKLILEAFPDGRMQLTVTGATAEAVEGYLLRALAKVQRELLADAIAQRRPPHRIEVVPPGTLVPR